MRAPPDVDRLARLARAQRAAIADPEVREVWDVVCSEIAIGHLRAEGRFSLATVLEALEAGGGLGADELSFDVDHEGGRPDRIVVGSGFTLPRASSCPREALLAELRRLLAGFRAAAPR